MPKGPIIIVEDDVDDQDIYKEIFREMNISNEVLFFANGLLALSYLKETTKQPFLIFSDINMPVMDGLKLRESIDMNPVLKNKSIPFILLTTTADPLAVKRAYELSVQGFFTKPISYPAIKNLFEMVIEYWKHCVHPNKLE